MYCFLNCGVLLVQSYILSALYYTGASSFEVKIEAESNDITEHPRDDKPTIGSIG